MSRVNGPVSMTASLEVRVNGDVAMRFDTEFVVSDNDEAEEKGRQFKELCDAFLEGYGAAA